MKKLISLFLAFILVFSLVSCSLIEGLVPGGNNTPGGSDNGGETPGGDNKPGDETPGGETPGGDGENRVCDCWIDTDGDAICDSCGSGGLIPPDGSDPKPNPNPDKPVCEDGCTDADGDALCDRCGHGVPVPPEERTPVIFLAGDSTVKTYEDDQFIGGWGQFLSCFLGEDVIVKNAAHGGRSSRSFINEGRLYDIEGSSYSFSQNGGHSIADDIQAGDYLFIQFGHNDDDTKKASAYGTMYDRMTPLGTPDANGIYPTTPAELMPTDYLPEAYVNLAGDAEESTALETIAKYGDEYYAYGSGTFKWYLKQYIDFARSVGAIPVLVTPVARVKFSGKEIVGGAGLHGVNFAYVEAVRQLAEEEDCLLIDLFARSKEILETATPTYANYLMALKPNELRGEWPIDYDSTYGNTEAGYTGIEATHYNKYGAFLQAAAVAEAILSDPDSYSFSDKVLTDPADPSRFVNPSNLIGRNTVAAIEGLFTKVNVTSPYRDYYDPKTVVDKINAIPTEVTSENYLEVKRLCEVARDCLAKVNIDDRDEVTNLALLEQYEVLVRAFEIASRPKPVKVVYFDADQLMQEIYDASFTEGDFTIVGTGDKKMEKKSKTASFTHNGETYENDFGLSVGGSAKFGQSRYVSFTVDGPCSITIAVQSSGSSARTLSMVNSSGSTVGSYEAGTVVTVSTVDITEAGTYSVGSAGSGMYIFAIIIEYFE